MAGAGAGVVACEEDDGGLAACWGEVTGKPTVTCEGEAVVAWGCTGGANTIADSPSGCSGSVGALKEKNTTSNTINERSETLLGVAYQND